MVKVRWQLVRAGKRGDHKSFSILNIATIYIAPDFSLEYAGLSDTDSSLHSSPQNLEDNPHSVPRT